MILSYSILFKLIIFFIILICRIEDVKWHIKDGTLHHILPIYGSGVEVISYDSKTGEKLKTRIIPAPFVSSKEKYVFIYFF